MLTSTAKALVYLGEGGGVGGGLFNIRGLLKGMKAFKEGDVMEGIIHKLNHIKKRMKILHPVHTHC